MKTHAATPHRSAAQQARLNETLRDIFEARIPFNRVLGLTVLSFDPENPRLAFDMRPDLVGSYAHGRLHGGMIAAALDTVGGFAVTIAIAEKYAAEEAEDVAHRFGRIGTIDLRVDYLRPGLGPHFVASAQLLRLGGRIATVRMGLEDAHGTLLAAGSAAYVVS